MIKNIKTWFGKIDLLSNWTIIIYFVLGSASIFLLIVRYIDYPRNNLLEIATLAVLWITAFVILIYTRQTRDLKNATLDLKEVTRKQLVETRRSLHLSITPFFRLEWSQESLYPGTENHGLWHIKIINEGEGIAIGFKMSFDNSDKLITRSMVGNKKIYLPVTEPNYKDFGIDKEGPFLEKFSPNNKYKTTIEYKDISGIKYKQVFLADENENSRFRLIEWDMPDAFRKIDRKMFTIKTEDRE